MSVIERTNGTEATQETVVDGRGPEPTAPDRSSAGEAPPDPSSPDPSPDERPRSGSARARRRAAVLHRGDPPGMRIRRVRLTSVVAIASVFFALGYLVTIATLVALWNAAVRLDFVADLEELVRSSLGLEEFDVVGQELFDLALVGFGVIFALGLVITILLTIVYNATSLLFGGLALETAPLRRTRRVFSLRHRSFVDVR